MSRPGTIAEVLEAARQRLRRLTPAEAQRASTEGAVVVDIRPADQRDAEGDLPGALVIRRNVLEWRLDPASDSRLPIADHDLPVIVLCQEGYASSPAAVALQDLGIHRATDVVGGYAAWRTSGVPAPTRPTWSHPFQPEDNGHAAQPGPLR